MSYIELNPKSLAAQLPADTYYHLAHTFSLTLPPARTDNADDLARRDLSAIAQVAAFCPVNAAEANLAALFVTHSEQAKHCFRTALQPETSPEWAMKCRAQAISMTRQALGALRHLERVQAARKKLEADNKASDRAAWTEHCALNLMAEALSSPPVPPATAKPPTEPPASSDCQPSSDCERGEAIPGDSGSIAPPRPQSQPRPAPEPRPARFDPTEPERAFSPQRAASIPVPRQIDDPDADLIRQPFPAPD